MSIYDFMTLPSWDDAKIIEEPHHLSEPLLERVSSHTTTPAVEGDLILLPTLNKVVVAQLDLRLARKSKGPSQVRVRPALATASEPSQPSKKSRLKKRALKAGSSTLKLRQAKGLNEADITNFCAELKDSMEMDEGTSIRAASVPTPRLGKRLGPPPSVTVTSVSGPAHVGTSAYASTSGRSLAFRGSIAGGFVKKSEAKDMRHQMDPLDALSYSALSCDVEYDENSLYTNLVASRVRLQEKLDRKKGDVKLLRLEVTSLYNKLEKLQRDYDTLGQENRDLRSQRDVASLEGVAHGTYDANFEVAARKVSNFHIGVEANFNKALIAFPTTLFPFLDKVDMAARGSLSKVTQILPDKLARLATSAHIALFVVNEGSDQVLLNHASDDSASSI
nr:hypothetical protein [Tanacetum cinerariifolium]